MDAFDTDSDKKTLAPTPFGLMVDRPVTSAPSRPSAVGKFFRWLWNIDRIFIFTVLVPMVLVSLYYGLFASDVYISESSFVVQSVQDQGDSSSGISSLLKSATSGSSDQDTASVQEYMQSRDALHLLEKNANLRAAYESTKVDAISRFGGWVWWDRSFESLFHYYEKKIVSLNAAEASSSISELKVSAFTAEEACLINRQLLDMGEKLVNTLNDRLQQDLVHYAEAEVTTSEKSALDAYLDLASYRQKHALVNPDQQASMQLTLLSKLESDLLDNQNQLSQLLTSSPNNPGIPALQNKVKNTQTQISDELSKATGDEKSFTNQASDYERLTFQRDFAQKQLSEAMIFLAKQRNDAQRKQLYLERIVEPNTPDVAVEPKSSRIIGATLILGLVTWGIISLFTAGVREHQQ